MPYIPGERRYALNPQNHMEIGKNPGELNFQITCLALEYLARHGLSYDTLNAVVGVLECAKLELTRRKVGPYEDGKRRDNGDVY